MEYDAAINEYNRILDEVRAVECKLRNISQDNLKMNVVQLREIMRILEKTALIKGLIYAIICHEDAR